MREAREDIDRPPSPSSSRAHQVHQADEVVRLREEIFGLVTARAEAQRALEGVQGDLQRALEEKRVAQRALEDLRARAGRAEEVMEAAQRGAEEARQTTEVMDDRSGPSSGRGGASVGMVWRAAAGAEMSREALGGLKGHEKDEIIVGLKARVGKLYGELQAGEEQSLLLSKKLELLRRNARANKEGHAAQIAKLRDGLHDRVRWCCDLEIGIVGRAEMKPQSLSPKSPPGRHDS